MLLSYTCTILEPLYACMHEGVYQCKQVYTGHALILQLGSCKYTQCAIKHEGVYQGKQHNYYTVQQ